MEPFQEQVANVVGMAKQLGFDYWLFVKDIHPIAVVIVGKEPLQLLGPIGTSLATFRMLDYNQPPDLLAEFVSAAVEIAHDHDVDYAYLTVPKDETQLIEQWTKAGFKEMEYRFNMVKSLDTPIGETEELRFEKVQRGELMKFLKAVKKTMSGSPDVILNMVLENLLEIPDNFLDIWFEQELLYFAYKDSELVGYIDLTPQEHGVSNLGVDPQHRGKGYGRQILLFGLHKLQELDHKQASLVVAANNTVAFNLYKSLNFQIEEQKCVLMWRKE
jgi:ribosomal protein S18 acetylase RimI-like enzyme